MHPKSKLHNRLILSDFIKHLPGMLVDNTAY